MEDFVVHRNLASPQLNGSFSHFPDSLHRQRACECKGNCNGKRVALISLRVKINVEKN